MKNFFFFTDQLNANNQYKPDMSSRENWRSNIPIPPQKPQNYKPPSQESNQHLLSWKPENNPIMANPKQEQDKMAHDLKHSKEHFQEKQEKKIEIKEIRIEKHPEHLNIDQHEQPKYPVIAEYKMLDSVDLQDGVAETPSGAILSLTLGMIITCIMAILIGCRLRVVRRRMRRGGKSYAHDADYLVNGMYL